MSIFDIGLRPIQFYIRASFFEKFVGKGIFTEEFLFVPGDKLRLTRLSESLSVIFTQVYILQSLHKTLFEAY